MPPLTSYNERYSADYQINSEGDEQSLLSRDRPQMESPLPIHDESVERCTQVKDTCQKHHLPSWSCQGYQSGRRRKSSSHSLGYGMGHDPDMNLPFETVLSSFCAWLNKIKMKSHGKYNQQLLSTKYDYQQDILDNPSSHIRLCLVRAKSTPSSQEHGKLENPGQYFAVKLFVRPRQNMSLKMYLRRVTGEFCIAHTLQHPNIVRVVELLSTDHGDLCEVMEFCDAGSLLNVLEQVTKLEPAEADCFLKQLLHGVQYMHSVGVSHRNLKPENILLTRQGTLKITDFCYAECFQMPWASSLLPPNKNERRDAGFGVNTQHQNLTGTIPFMAPEQFARTTFDPAAGDMWAVGIIYFAMRSGRLPWKSATCDDLLYRSYMRDLESGRCNKYMELVSGDLRRSVIYSILQPTPRRRLTATQALDSDWIRGIKLKSSTFSRPPQGPPDQHQGLHSKLPVYRRHGDRLRPRHVFPLLLQTRGIPFHALILAFEKYSDGFYGYSEAELTCFNTAAQSVYFITLVFLQWGNILSVRNKRLSILQADPIRKQRRNPWLLAGAVVSLAIAVFVTEEPGLQSIFETASAPIEFWFYPIPLALGIDCQGFGRGVLWRDYFHEKIHQE
ncbi:hypothetical protein UA08_08200 [Talaromyces atroroseus]|uniref:non-specific serine/threonine protein kinase n=1 Tax=Talaromyces atroroseus TaxID=1441469 RepID=A0A225A7I1_TALAT|nr:hypothetical protein UA08_08200 [Talaromyces atroroseus]OKL56472.1 hypothetical protein UA08_08200 [Talaromyces atroroseus]